MKTIEIYEKIKTAIEGADVDKALSALNFVQQELYTEQSKIHQRAALGSYGGILGAANLANQCVDPHEQAVAMVKAIAREEIEKAKCLATEEKVSA